MRTVFLRGTGWPGARAGMTEGFFDRLVGIRSPTGAEALMIDSRLLHTFGLSGSLHMIALDDGMRVVEIREVAPNRLVWFKRARLVLELWRGPVPELGTRLEMDDA